VAGAAHRRDGPRCRRAEDLYAHECRGGCHWTSHVLLGERGDNPFCHHRALELLREGVRERVRCVEAAPGLPFDHARYEVYREPWPASERAAIERLHAEVEAETCGPFTNADAR